MNESKGETKKKCFVGDNYVPPRERPRNNNFITSFFKKRPYIGPSIVETKDIFIDKDLNTI